MTQIASVGMSGGMPIIEDDDPIPGLEVESVYIPGPRGFHFGGLFKGYWDMSSGTSGPAVPVTDYYATHTDTTITPAAVLGGNGPLLLSASATANLLPTNGAATISVPAISESDTTPFTLFAICNSGASLSDIESAINGRTPSGPTWFALFSVALGADPSIGAAHYNNDAIAYDGAAFCSTGDAIAVGFDFNTGVMTASINEAVVVSATAAFGDVPVGQSLKLLYGLVSLASNCVFSAGSLGVTISGFATAVNATPPVGAEDGDWYEVSAGGYFHGKTTRTGQFVKLIRDKTDLIVVDNPADTGTTALEAETVTHFSDINTAGLSEPRLYVVTDDETNDNQRTQYLYDGTTMMWLVAVEA